MVCRHPGGCGDHAAIKYGRLGVIAHMISIPKLVIESYIPFPRGFKVAIFNSGIEADKTGREKQKFNEKIAAYELGEIYLRKYIKELYPDVCREEFYLADLIEYLIEYLRDTQIYNLLLKLPRRVFRKDLGHELQEYSLELEKQFATHNEPREGYPVRAAVTYGIAECARAKMLSDLLRDNRTVSPQ